MTLCNWLYSFNFTNKYQNIKQWLRKNLSKTLISHSLYIVKIGIKITFCKKTKYLSILINSLIWNKGCFFFVTGNKGCFLNSKYRFPTQKYDIHILVLSRQEKGICCRSMIWWKRKGISGFRKSGEMVVTLSKHTQPFSLLQWNQTFR